MIIQVLFVVFMALWGISCFPHPTMEGYRWANSLLAFLSVLMLGLFLFMPGLR